MQWIVIWSGQKWLSYPGQEQSIAKFKLAIVKLLSLEEQRLHLEVQTASLKISTFGTSKQISGDLVLSKFLILPILFFLNLTIHFCRLNTAINKVGCGLINDRHDYSKKVVVCGTPTDKVEVWDIANRLVYKTTHDCPNTGYGNFKELDNNYHDHEDFNTKYVKNLSQQGNLVHACKPVFLYSQLVFTNSQSEVYIFDLYNGFKQSYTIAESTGGNAFVAPRGTIAAGTAACTASTQN